MPFYIFLGILYQIGTSNLGIVPREVVLDKSPVVDSIGEIHLGALELQLEGPLRLEFMHSNSNQPQRGFPGQYLYLVTSVPGRMALSPNFS
jgi:hypothetical protein